MTLKKLKSKSFLENLVRDAIKAKVDGIVCSGHELKDIEKIEKRSRVRLIKNVPGIRSKLNAIVKSDDQVRSIQLKQVIDLGADYAVVGRSITREGDVLKALNNLWHG